MTQAGLEETQTSSTVLDRHQPPALTVLLEAFQADSL